MSEKRGVKLGSKRGKYSASKDAKTRILAAYNQGEDWKTVARFNGVKMATVYGWINRIDSPEKKRGGKRYNKVTNVHVDAMVNYIILYSANVETDYRKIVFGLFYSDFNNNSSQVSYSLSLNY